MKKHIVKYIITVFTTIGIQSQTIFNLPECIDYALAHNIDIQSNILQAKINENNVLINKASMLPTVTANASQSANVYFVNDKNLTLYTSQVTPVSVNWTVFNGFQNLNTFKKSKIDKAITEKNQEVLEKDISLNIANFYLQVLFNKELVTIAENQLELSKKQKQFVEKRLSIGSLAKSDLADTDAVVAQDESNLVQRENSVRTSILNIKNLLFYNVNEPLELETINPDTYIQNLALQDAQSVYDYAEAHWPLLDRDRLSIESAEKNIDIAKGASKPQINLGYSLGTNYLVTNKGNSDIFTDQVWQNLGNQFSASISMPIFNGNINKNRVKNAQIELEQSQLQLTQDAYTLRQNIEAAYIEATNAQKTYEAAIRTKEARALSLEFSQKRFEIGSMNIFDFETARNNWVQASVSLVQAKYDFIFKVKVLEFYAGKSF